MKKTFKATYFAIKRNIYVISTLITKFRLIVYKIKYGKNFISNGLTYIWKSYSGRIVIGDNVTINNTFKSNLVGLNHKTALVTLDNGEIIIGNNVGISGAIISARTSIILGNNVLLGGNVRIFDHDFHPLDPEERQLNLIEKIKTNPILINSNVFIGTNSIILKGTIIGKNSVIGAGSIVSAIIPENEIWAGNPAKKVRNIGL
jgi:acetyltransferase-like isoleucine patch superfamily enzyme